MSRINFLASTREQLEDRAGSRCSFPGCPAVTKGPSKESAIAVSKTGRACHIISASQGQGARRRRTNEDESEIKDISNGIWMCANHGDLIDADETVYTIEMLRTWRKLAEFRAEYEHKYGEVLDFDKSPPIDIPVVAEEVILSSTTNINKILGELFIHCCVPQIWGTKSSDAIRDLLIEMTLNAFEHAGTNEVTVHVEPKRITLRHSGPEFDPLCLLPHAPRRGGSGAVAHMSDVLGNQVALTYSYMNEINELIIVVPNTPEDILAATPCSMTLDVMDRSDKIAADFKRTSGCSVIYILVPRFFGWSDARKITDIIKQHVPSGKRLVFVAEDISDGVAARIRESLAGANVIQIRGNLRGQV